MNNKELLNILKKENLPETKIKNNSDQKLSQNLLIDADLMKLISDSVDNNIWQLLEEIIQEAELKAWSLYVVGGIVRDLFLLKKNQKILIQYIDLVVDSNTSP